MQHRTDEPPHDLRTNAEEPLNIAVAHGVATANPSAVARGTIVDDPPKEEPVEVRRLAIISSSHVRCETFEMLHERGMAPGGKNGVTADLRHVILSADEYSVTVRPLDPDDLPDDTPDDLREVIRAICVERGMDGVVLDRDANLHSFLPTFDW